MADLANAPFAALTNQVARRRLATCINTAARDELWGVDVRSSRRRAEKLSYPLVMMVGMHVVSLKLIDTSGPDAEVDTWIECCMHCGTLDNCGNTFCVDCDDLAA